jgi:hypothetical protein
MRTKFVALVIAASMFATAALAGGTSTVRRPVKEQAAPVAVQAQVQQAELVR